MTFSGVNHLPDEIPSRAFHKLQQSVSPGAGGGAEIDTSSIRPKQGIQVALLYRHVSSQCCAHVWCLAVSGCFVDLAVWSRMYPGCELSIYPKQGIYDALFLVCPAIVISFRISDRDCWPVFNPACRDYLSRTICWPIAEKLGPVFGTSHSCVVNSLILGYFTVNPCM